MGVRADRGLVCAAPPDRDPAYAGYYCGILAAEADREFRPVTIARRAAAIAAGRRAQDHQNPCDSGAVAVVLSGIRRQHGTRAPRAAAPLELDPLARLLEPIDAAPEGHAAIRAEGIGS